jgi:hypothetical protein
VTVRAHRGDARRLAFILLLCLAAAALGEWLPLPEAPLAVAFEEPAAADTLRGLVQLRGWAVAHRAEIPLHSVAVFLDDARPALLGYPLLVGERGRPGRAAFELGWETCTFAPGAYTLRVVVRAADGLEAADARSVTVASCPSGPLAVLREEGLASPSRAWREGTTACLSADFRDSAYRLVRRADGEEPCGVWDGAHVVYADFVLSVTLEFPRAAPDLAAQVAFRATPRAIPQGVPEGLDGYLVRLEPATDTISLWRHAAEGPQLLARARLGTANPFYQLDVLAVDDLFGVRVNGRTALTARDDGPRWGRLLLGVAGAPDEATVLYRDLVLRRPPRAPGGDAVALAATP